MLERLPEALAHPFLRLFAITNPFSIYTLFGALLCALSWYALRRPHGPLRRIRAFMRAGFALRVLRHRSSILDYKLFFVTSLIFGTGVIGLFLSAEAIAGLVFAGLEALLGPPPRPQQPHFAWSVLVTIAVVLLDLGYWAHWLMHRLPLFWEFHKLHHSAEVMTPALIAVLSPTPKRAAGPFLQDSRDNPLPEIHRICSAHPRLASSSSPDDESEQSRFENPKPTQGKLIPLLDRI